MKRILLIAVPGIGDAFLATPLLASLKRAYPQAAIDVLVREGRSAVENNPHVSRVLVQRRRPALLDNIRFLARIFRRYDLAISTTTTDRAFINLLLAAPKRLGKVAALTPQTWWKRQVVRDFVVVDQQAHVLSENLRFADALGIERSYTPVLPRGEVPGTAEAPPIPSDKYAVVHLKPGAIVRQWPDEHWIVIIDWLLNHGLSVAATGSPDDGEVAYVERIRAGTSAPARFHNLAGKLGFGQIAALAGAASVFVGTDTSTTHVAAATGVATVALFGPTYVVRWGPWPKGFEHRGSPWRADRPSQTVGNVTVLKNSCSCDTVRQNCTLRPGGCGACMEQLLPAVVLAELDRRLNFANRAAVRSRPAPGPGQPVQEQARGYQPAGHLPGGSGGLHGDPQA